MPLGKRDRLVVQGDGSVVMLGVALRARVRGDEFAQRFGVIQLASERFAALGVDVQRLAVGKRGMRQREHAPGAQLLRLVVL